ncbi:MAG: DUF1122 family protein [Chloroflexi bacterium]|nr:DUF1122 family protein [Chloroflexota bacterium]
MPADRSALANLLRSGWIVADPGANSVDALQGKPLNSHELVVLLGPKNRVGARYFQIFVKSPGSDEISAEPLVAGLHAMGEYPSYNWIEIMTSSRAVDLGEGESIMIGDALIRKVFHLLADLIPPGGHMMVEYDSPEQEETARSLASGVPAAATPVGFTLFSVGCGAGFKDWYFAEGGSEGPRKLQGHKALNKEHAELKAEATARELRAFLERPAGTASEWEGAARARALAVLGWLKQGGDAQALPAQGTYGRDRAGFGSRRRLMSRAGGPPSTATGP